MKAYKILDQYDKYQELQLDLFDLAKQLGIDSESDEFSRLMYAGKNNQSVLDLWQDSVRAEFKVPVDWPNAVEIPDVCLWNYSAMVFSEVAHMGLKNALKEFGEFLPIVIDGVRFYIFNILSKITIDTTRCEYEYLEGLDDLIAGVKKIAFIDSELSNKGLFLVNHYGVSGAYCNDHFKSTIEEIGLKGVTFSER